jgi:hypothetical protein
MQVRLKQNIMLQINLVKNINPKSITYAANSLILMKYKETETKTGIKTSVTYIEVCELKDTKEITIVQSLLKFCLAEYRVAKKIETDYSDTGITQKRILQSFLNGNTIFRSDSEGKLCKALKATVNFNQTALNIETAHRIVNCEPQNLRPAIYRHSQAILEQCEYLSTIDKEIKAIIELTKEDVEKIRAAKSALKTDVKAA